MGHERPGPGLRRQRLRMQRQSGSVVSCWPSVTPSTLRDMMRREERRGRLFEDLLRCVWVPAAPWPVQRAAGRPCEGVHPAGSGPASRLITNACAVQRDGISGFVRMLRRGYNGPKLTHWKGFCRTIGRSAC